MEQIKTDTSVKATPLARRLAREYGLELAGILPGGRCGEIRARDVEAARNRRVRVTPLARSIAAKKGIELSGVKGSGFGGKIVKADVLGVTALPAAAPARGTPMNAMRRVIARRMVSSHTEIPPVTTCVKVDVTELLKLRERINAGREKADKISVNDFIIKATCMALAENPRFRMQLDGDSYVMTERFNIGMAVGLDDGLVVPVLKDVDRMSLDEIARSSKELAGKARRGGLKPADMGGGVISISNLGMFGTYCFTPIVNQPEASIIGVCSIEDELALSEEGISVRRKTILCTTYDHRIINGMEASKFQADLKALLEEPSRILGNDAK